MKKKNMLINMWILHFEHEMIDLNVLCDILETLKHEEKIHYFGMVIQNIFENNAIKNSENILTRLYKESNCSVCREAFLQTLIRNQQISENLLREMQYDCEPEIRQLARQYSQKC